MKVGLQRAPTAQELLELRGRTRWTEIIALYEVTALVAQEIELLHGLHALCYHLHIEAVGHEDDGARESGIAWIGGEIVDERTVELEHMHEEALQIAQARLAGAEVVHRELHAHCPQPAVGLHRRLRVFHDAALGALELEVIGRQTAPEQDLLVFLVVSCLSIVTARV